MRYHIPVIMPVACPILPHSEMVSQEKDLDDRKMICERMDGSAPLGGDSTIDDSELEIVFEEGVESDAIRVEDCDRVEEELDDEDDEGSDSESGEVSYDDEDYGYDYESADDTHSNCQDTPFWFSHEEPDQITEIIKSYTETLKLDLERKACVRAPPPFVGRVKRIQVDNDLFTTLDQVSIYLRDVKPLGISLPLRRYVWLLTSWDAEDGIPIRSFEISKDSLLEFWQNRSHGSYSYLYCRPIYHTKCEWEFEASSSDTPVVYASPFYSPTQSFSLYLPNPTQSPTDD